MGSFSADRKTSRGKTDVWGEQSPFLQDLYQRGAGLMQQFQPDQGITQAMQQQINPQMNPYLGEMTQQYTQALGQLDQASGRGAAGAGVFGGGRQGVEQHLNQQNIGNQVGNFLGGQYQADQARAVTALSMAPQLTPWGQQMGAMQGYSGLIGPPAMRASSRSSGWGASGSYMSPGGG